MSKSVIDGKCCYLASMPPQGQEKRTFQQNSVAVAECCCCYPLSFEKGLRIEKQSNEWEKKVHGGDR